MDVSYSEYKNWMFNDVMGLITTFATYASNHNLLITEPEHFKDLINLSRYSSLYMVVDNRVVGALCGIKASSTMSREEIWQELLYYVTPEYRLKSRELYKNFEAYIKDKGFKTLVFGAVEDENIEKMTRLYKQMGYKATERIYTKKI